MRLATKPRPQFHADGLVAPTAPLPPSPACRAGGNDWEEALNQAIAQFADLLDAEGAALSQIVGFGELAKPICATGVCTECDPLDGLDGQADPTNALGNSGWFDLPADQDNSSPFSWSGVAARPRLSVLNLFFSERRRERLVLRTYFANLDHGDRGRIAAKGVKLARMLMPVHRLWSLGQAAERRAEALDSVLNRLDGGVLLIDARMRVHYANAAATMLIEAHDGVQLNFRTLTATDVHDALRLQVAVSHVTARQSGGTTVSDRSSVVALRRLDHDRPLLAAIRPVSRPAISDGETCAIVHLIDPDRDCSRMIVPACEHYGLTVIETQLTTLLCGGATLADAATALRIKEQTARSYLKQIFMKTNTNRQAELVRVMLTSGVQCGTGEASRLV